MIPWDNNKAREIIMEKMLKNDLFSRWLDIQVEKISESSVLLSCMIREEMTNGFKVSHGGIVYSLCDSALAFHSNAGGRKAMSVETSINHLMAVHTGDKITARTSVIKAGRSLGHYLIEASNQDGKPVAIMKGMVFYTGESW